MQIKKSKIKYSDLYGLGKEKYEFLENHEIKSTKWQVLDLDKFENEFRKTRWSQKYKYGFHFFIPKIVENIVEYGNFFGVDEIFKNYNAGIATGKDEILVANNKNELITKLSIKDEELFKMTMKNYKISDKLIKDWISELKNINLENQIQRYSYRPFDDRFILYDSKVLQRARKDIMDNFLFNNLGLCLSKQLSTEFFQHSFITDSLIDRCYISLATREVIYVFPLYLYQQQKTEPIFNGQSKLALSGTQPKIDEQTKSITSNIKKEILELLKIKYKKPIKPEEVFNYIYAVLYSNKYRNRFNEFLKIDFPKVPFTADYKLFKELSGLGQELAELHLLKSKKLGKTTAKFKGQGLNNVKKREYNKKEKILYINDNQYFEGIEPEVWEYYIGGYQVLDKWIKDRIGRNLSREEVEHYLKVIASLQYTIDLQKGIDELYMGVEKNLI